MIKEYSVSGTALTGETLEARDVTIVVQDGIITAVEDESSVPDQWICPAFFNAHTHLADTVAMDLPCAGTLDELVTPPHGLKHQILAKTSVPRLISAMRDSITEMIHSGTAGFADFREGGKPGVLALQEAASQMHIRPIILGREGGEEIADGAGISSARDVTQSMEIADLMKRQGKIIGFHAGEKDPDDIDAALEAHPDFLVHCTHVTKSQIRRIADEGIPVVLCCRSNFLLRVTSGRAHPPVQEMIDAGVEILIGTDNVMFVQPDMMQEISFIHSVYGVPAENLLYSATRGFPPSGISHSIMPGNRASFCVMDCSWGNLRHSRDIKSTIVKRAPMSHFCARIF
ncbi:amidohydrolase [Methanospirillum hungatei JF-1]|uniref:Amidohydrolase n=1 Tax=Methanospirillum hungatei JF-1 (strain ATCC 27890 / DSM 864 / NBRC 100397 / JF-1) TaxID=323259 RepID=Q2FQL3_METHJ|nr:amidohydrolase family protein [Methanospirillum hungatei]ABD40601.1 amidohydrolase [Methanospirillum hungatei JF-1]